jgi:hypothetical protein
MSTTKSWRHVLPVHPAAKLLPMISQDALRELGEDIKAHGLLFPVVVFEGQLLDGRNRLDAMELAGFDLIGSDGKIKSGIIFNYVGAIDPIAYALSANLHRRHLTNEQKRTLISDLLKATPEKSNRQIAELAKVDHKTVATVRTEREASGEIPHTETHTDRKGAKRPAHKAAKREAPFAAPSPEASAVVEPVFDDREESPSGSAGGTLADQPGRDPADPVHTVAQEIVAKICDDVWHTEEGIVAMYGDLAVDALFAIMRKPKAFGVRIWRAESFAGVSYQISEHGKVTVAEVIETLSPLIGKLEQEGAYDAARFSAHSVANYARQMREQVEAWAKSSISTSSPRSTPTQKEQADRLLAFELGQSRNREMAQLKELKLLRAEIETLRDEIKAACEETARLGATITELEAEIGAPQAA